MCSPPAVCCLAAYLHSPTHTVVGLLKNPAPSAPTALLAKDQRGPNWSLAGRAEPLQQFVWYRTVQRQQVRSWLKSDLPEGVAFPFFSFVVFSPSYSLQRFRPSDRPSDKRRGYVGLRKCSGHPCWGGSHWILPVGGGWGGVGLVPVLLPETRSNQSDLGWGVHVWDKGAFGRHWRLQEAGRCALANHQGYDIGWRVITTRAPWWGNDCVTPPNRERLGKG